LWPDAAGNLYMDDYFNSRIRKVTTAGVITTIAGNGSWGYSGDEGPATNAAIDDVWSIRRIHPETFTWLII
jgi:hypothetical protein